MKTVLVNGDFNILHPGHLRLLKFAKDNGDYLIVALNSNALCSNSNMLDEAIRLESIKATSYVDKAFILTTSIEEYIKANKPHVVVKGSEHEDKFNIEKKELDTYGGELIFASGDIQFSSLDLLRHEFMTLETSHIHYPLSFIKRHNIDSIKLLKILDDFSKLNVLVVGDTILDEYKTCEPLGMSQEDPTIVVSPISSDIFLGGAGIVAAHSRRLGANVELVSVLGNDDNAKIVEEKLNEYDIKSYIYKDTTRPTTFKQRFRANNKTLLRVNHFKQHHISQDIQDKIFNDIKKNIKNKNLIVFSDFSYGCLPNKLIDKIIQIGLNNNIMMVADSQSSSQVGDIAKFKNMSLITPTEREARLGVNDFESGLVVLAEKLRQKSNAKNIFITLGSEGLFIHASQEDERVTDQIPVLNNLPKDVAGAGDSLLISVSMAVALGASVFEGAYIGSLSAAAQVGRVGNTPLKTSDIRKNIQQ